MDKLKKAAKKIDDDATKDTVVFEVDQQVEARFGGNEKWYSGKIMSKKEGEAAGRFLYDIAYDGESALLLLPAPAHFLQLKLLPSLFSRPCLTTNMAAFSVHGLSGTP